MFSRQNTARAFIIGPVLDSAGVAVTTCVIGDFKISVNGGAFAALNGSATLTHRAGGQYTLSATSSDFATVGTLQFVLDKGTDACQKVDFQVIEEAVFDALFASGATGLLPANVTQMANGVITADVLANNAITDAKIANNAFTAAKFHSDFFTATAAAVEASILNEGDATALMAAIAAKVEEFLVNDGDSAATLQAIATAVWTNATRELSSGANLNNLSSSDVQDAALAALVAIHLDHLFAAAYDPAAKPGAADALLNELVENDGGVARFTANALEQSPGSSAPTANENADALLDRLDAIETGLTLRKAFRGFAAVLLGKASGSGTPSIKFRSAVTDDKERVVMAAAGNNRTSVTLDLD